MQNEDELLDDFSFEEQSEQNIQLITASTGKRFLNNLIDGIVIQCFAVPVQLGMSMADDNLSSLVITLGGQFAYYTLLESLNNGKTLGKMATGTRVVSDYGYKAEGGAIALRTLCRFVPFNAISIFFNDNSIMWHDKWSATIVIDEKQSTLPE